MSPTFLAAIYLDASNMDKLTAEQKDVAEAAVLQLVLKMKSLETPADNSDCMDSPAISSSAGDDSNSDEDMREAEKIRYFKPRTQVARQCSRIQIRKSRSSMAHLLLLLLTAVSQLQRKEKSLPLRSVST